MIVCAITLSATTVQEVLAKVTQVLAALSSSSYGFLGSFFLGLLLSPLTEIVKKRVIHATFGDIEMRTIPQGTFFITRLSIRNKGRAAAGEARAHLESISDNRKIRKDFIPCPIWWTHGQVEKAPVFKDLRPHEAAQLDILKLTQDRNGNCDLRFQIAAGLEHDTFSKIYAGRETKGIIGIYELGGRTAKIEITTSWDGSFSEPDVSFRKIS